VFVANVTITDWPNVGHYSPVTPSMQKQSKKKKRNTNEQFTNLDHSAFRGKSQTAAL